MAKFKEVLPALREGKIIKRKNGELISLSNEGYNLLLQKDIHAEDWEIYEEPKQKVPYYPVLVKIRFGEVIPYYEKKFKNLEEAKQLEREQYMTNPPKSICTVIRLITETPELIDWRDE